jgi:hypothetical protein
MARSNATRACPSTWAARSAIALSAVVVPGLARAAPLPDGIEIRWSGAEGCPAREDVEAQIADRLRTRGGEIRATVVIAVAAVDPDGYVLDLAIETDGDRHERRLEASECALLVRATSVIVDVAVDPHRTSDDIARAMSAPVVGGDATVPAPVAKSTTRVPPPEPQTQPVPAEAGTLDDPTAPTPFVQRDQQPESNRPRSRSAIDVAAGPRGGGGAGILPGFGGGIGFVAAVTGGLWRVEGQFSHWFARAQTFADEPTVGADLSLWSGGARGCGVPVVHRLEIPICAGGEIGRLRAVGFGARESLTVTATWAAVVLAPSVIWLPRPWVGLFAGIDAVVAINRPGFSGESRPELHRAFPIAARGLAGVEFRIGTGVLARNRPG